MVLLMKLNQAGIDLIKSHEGCRLESYQDIVGKWTIGYGCTGPEIVAGLTWSQEDCDKILMADLDHLQARLTKLITKPINDNQFSACCSLAYNIGVGAFKSSTLLRLINEGALLEAANSFILWDHAGGREIQGLLTRRLDEKKLFLS